MTDCDGRMSPPALPLYTCCHLQTYSPTPITRSHPTPVLHYGASTSITMVGRGRNVSSQHDDVWVCAVFYYVMCCGISASSTALRHSSIAASSCVVAAPPALELATRTSPASRAGSSLSRGCCMRLTATARSQGCLPGSGRPYPSRLRRELAEIHNLVPASKRISPSEM